MVSLDPIDVDRNVEAEARVAVECFKVGFRGDAHKQLYEQVQRIRDIANAALHYSPYTAIVQSSCIGKTRSVMEMSTLGVYICYCSMAGEHTSAYPPRTESLADRLVSSRSELEMVLYLKAWLHVLIQELERGVSPVEWKEKQLPGGGSDYSGLARRVREEWNHLIASTPAAAAAPLVNKDDVYGELIGAALQRVEELLFVEDPDSGSDSDEPLSKAYPRVIFVFDEARGLTTPSEVPFAVLRSALRVLFDWRSFFALMLDTSAKVSSFLPKRSKVEDSSHRALRSGVSLLPPIYHLPTLELNVPQPGGTLDEYTRPETWMRYGRPVWAARMAQDGAKRLLPWAAQKLLGGGRPLTSDLEDSEAMALLAAATGVQVCPRSPLGEKLVASHMSILLRVTPERVFVAMPAEPILSEAAAQVLRDDKVKLRALIYMEDACMAGYATVGPRGEFVAKFILAAAVWDLAGVRVLQPIKLRDLLRKLLLHGRRDSETKNAFSKVEALLPRGILFFNSFVAVGRVPDADMLTRCFAGGHAIVYEADNNKMPGSDIIVPVWLPSGMSCILLSVQNQKRSGWWEEPALEELKAELSKLHVGDGVPIITILMSLREPDVATRDGWMLWDEASETRGKYVKLACYGLDNNYGYLSAEIKSLLKNILVTRPDPLQGANKREAEWIKKVLPHQYMDMPAFHMRAFAPE